VPLTPRERVLTALDHREPDRVPIFIGASNAIGIKMPPYRRIAELIGVEPTDQYIYDWPELGTVALDEPTLRRLGSDVRGVFDAFPAAIRERRRTRDPHSPFIDDWGGGQVEVDDGVWFPGIHPLASATTLAELEAYPWPDMDDPTRVAHVRAEAARLREANEFAVLGAPWLMFPFERAFAMQGMEDFLPNMRRQPEFAEALLRRITDLCLVLMGHFLDEAGDNLDIVKIGDDLGTQQALMISPVMYRKMLKPLHAELIALIKSRSKAKVFFHSCGDVSTIVDDFVEIGVDILNPIQTATGGLSDLAALKRRHGANLTFCGAIDTQQILPNGTPEEVRAEVRRVISELAPGGGYLLAAVHTVMDETPAENVLAMVDAALEYGRYPIRE
jgi:uroporphyrinogen decarboxylase